MRPMRTAKLLLGLAALGLAPSAPSGQGGAADAPTSETLVKQGDTVIGMGPMTFTLNWVAVDDDKRWFAQIGTDLNPDDINRDGCILSNGFVTLREGAPLSAPAGAVLDDWSSVSLNDLGDLGMVIQVKPLTGAGFTAVYWNLTPVAKKDDKVDAATNSVPPGPLNPPTPTAPNDWDTFSVAKLNAKNQIFVIGEIVQSLTTRNKEKSLVRYQLDDAGHITGTTVLATEGMTIPAGLLLRGQNCILTNEHVLGINNRGDFITIVGQDNIQWVVINAQTAVAKTLDVSPIPGKTWNNFNQGRVAINDRGDWVFSGTLQPTGADDYLVVKNGQKFVQSNDFFPAISPLAMTKGSSAPIYIANTGDVFWHGRIGTSDSFMRNKDAIVVSNQTIVDNRLVTSVLGGENGFAISPNGRFWIGNVQLQSIGTAALFVDYGLVLELPGCRGNQGKLSHASGAARVGMTLQLAMDKAQAPGALTSIFFSRQGIVSANGCGVNIRPYGEVFLAPPLIGSFPLPPWNGTSPSLMTINIPNNISLVDSTLFAQGVFVSPGHPTEGVRLTNGLRIEIGAP